MSHDDRILAGKDEIHGSTSRRSASAKPQEASAAALKCPRCDSTNTKFCYYNNYNLTQPRHFCKTCRRYWTKGGALRNVPIGGGCRKNKKIKSFQRDPKEENGPSDIGGFRFFQGISPPAMDFQLGGLNFQRLQPSNTTNLFNQFPSYGNLPNISGTTSSGPHLIFDPPPTSSPHLGLISTTTQGFQEMGSSNLRSNLASSIESLSSINQDLHLKLQQQRLSMMYVGNNLKENSTNVPSESDHIMEPLVQKPQPILFQNLDISKQDYSNPTGISRKEGAVDQNLSTEWFFENSYATVTPSAPATSRSYANESTSNWSGSQAWSSHDLSHYNSLP